jgi:hypothetical protein
MDRRAFIKAIGAPAGTGLLAAKSGGHALRRICFQRRKINLSQVFAGQKVGVKQPRTISGWSASWNYDLGYFDDETCRLEPIDDPFGPRLLPMSPEYLLPVCPEYTGKDWLLRLDSNQQPSG